jgi:hypothetical protein
LDYYGCLYAENTALVPAIPKELIKLERGEQPIPGFYELFFRPIICFLDDQPEQQGKTQAAHVAMDEGDQESQPEPEDAGLEELSQDVPYASL